MNILRADDSNIFIFCEVLEGHPFENHAVLKYESKSTL